MLNEWGTDEMESGGSKVVQLVHAKGAPIRSRAEVAGLSNLSTPRKTGAPMRSSAEVAGLPYLSTLGGVGHR